MKQTKNVGANFGKEMYMVLFKIYSRQGHHSESPGGGGGGGGGCF